MSEPDIVVTEYMTPRKRRHYTTMIAALKDIEAIASERGENADLLADSVLEFIELSIVLAGSSGLDFELAKPGDPADVLMQKFDAYDVTQYYSLIEQYLEQASTQLRGILYASPLPDSAEKN